MALYDFVVDVWAELMNGEIIPPGEQFRVEQACRALEGVEQFKSNLFISAPSSYFQISGFQWEYENLMVAYAAWILAKDEASLLYVNENILTQNAFMQKVVKMITSNAAQKHVADIVYDPAMPRKFREVYTGLESVVYNIAMGGTAMGFRATNIICCYPYATHFRGSVNSTLINYMLRGQPKTPKVVMDFDPVKTQVFEDLQKYFTAGNEKWQKLDLLQY